MRTEMPLCFGTSDRVRTGHMPKSAMCALLLQVFWPLTTYESPSRLALVSRPARSDPPLGSDRNWIQSSWPERILARCSCFCSWVPKAARVAPRMLIDTPKFDCGMS